MTESIISEIQKAFSVKFGRDVDRRALEQVCGLFTPIANCEEITFVRNIFSFLQIKAKAEPEPEPIVVSEGVGRYSFLGEEWKNQVLGGEPNSTLKSHLRYLPDGDITRWDEWVDASPNTFESRRVRLQYVLKWADKTEGLEVEDKAIASDMLANLKVQYADGKVENIGVKTTEKKLAEQGIIQKWFSEPVRPPRSAFEVFGKYLPIRRSMDTSFFFVFDDMKAYEAFDLGDGKPINAFVKDCRKFFFGRFKNVEAIGAQEFDADAVRQIAPSPSHFDEGIKWLMDRPNGFRFTKVLNPTSQFSHWNPGLSNNSFRHFMESVVAKKLPKQTLILMQTWLCHSANVSQKYYSDV